MTEIDIAEAQLPGEWRLMKESGWLPLGADGRLIDTIGYVVMEPHVIAYGNDQDRINRGTAFGNTPDEAVAAFRARFPDGAPKAS